MANARSRVWVWSVRRMAVRGAAVSFLFFAAVTSVPAETRSSKAGTSAPASARPVSSISGAGATFPYPVYAQWAAAYRKETGVRLNYQAIGSGGGVKQILARAVTFGASDMPLSGSDLSKEDLAQFPAMLGGVVAVVNLDGVASGELTLDGPTAARIFLGEIRKWDDPAITRLNPSLKLPPADIVTIHRADGSGTTLSWTDYLSKVSPDWKSRIGSGTYVEWPVGYGAKGGEGVSGPLSQTAGGITYMEYAYAKQNRLAYIKLVNRRGEAVAPDREAIQAAAANADWASASGFGLLLTDQPGAGSWPIVHTTFVLMPRKAPNARESAAALAFFNWGYDKGGPLAEQLDFVPLPPEVIKMVKRSWKEITADGKPVFSRD
jgi:phosphate transport system substrate-binding protein